MSVFDKVPYYSVGQALAGGVSAYSDAKERQLKREMLERQMEADSLYKSAVLGGRAADTAIKTQQAEEDRELKKRMQEESLKIQREKLDLDKLKLEKEGQSKKLAASLTPAQKKIDEVFAKDYNDWKLQGGYGTVKRNLNDLSGVINELEENKGFLGKTGPLAGLFAGSSIQDVINPEASAIQDRINRIIMGSLRSTLGAQFTEKEGKRVLEATFNPRQPPEENIARLKSLMGELEKQAKAKEDASSYFEETGTMQGYKGPSFSEINTPSSLQDRAPKKDRKMIFKDPEAMEALNWAKKNKNDPRAIKILEALGER